MVRLEGSEKCYFVCCAKLVSCFCQGKDLTIFFTGLSQISCTVDQSMAVLGGDQADRYYIQHVLGRRLAMDAEYIRNRSTMTDLALIGRTLGVILRGVLRRAA